MTLPRLNIEDIKPISEYNSTESLDESNMEDVDENELSDDDSSNWLQYIVGNYIFWFLSPVLVSVFQRGNSMSSP